MYDLQGLEPDENDQQYTSEYCHPSIELVVKLSFNPICSVWASPYFIYLLRVSRHIGRWNLKE